MDTFQLVSRGLAKKLGIEPEEITMDSELSTLGIDSLDAAELLMELEDKLGVEIEPSKRIANVRDIVAEIDSIIS